jgi:hypothetical protein
MNLKSMFVCLSLASAYFASCNSINCARGLLFTPTYGLKDAVFSVCAYIDIKGTPEQLFSTILDFRRYNEWNTFVYNAEVLENVTSASDVYLGMPVTLFSTGIVPDLNSTSMDVISGIKRPYWVAWTNTAQAALVGYVEHVNLFLPVGNGMSRYISYETHYGNATILIPFIPNLQRQFEVQGLDLKKRVEGQ